MMISFNDLDYQRKEASFGEKTVSPDEPEVSIKHSDGHVKAVYDVLHSSSYLEG